MAHIKPELIEPLLMNFANNLHAGAASSVLTFEVQSRIDNVPQNLLELFFMQQDTTKIERWHRLPPWERFSWVATLLRYRCPGVDLNYTKNGTMQILFTSATDSNTITITVDLPPAFANTKSFWKGMDDFCLMIGVCFYVAVLNIAGNNPIDSVFDDPEAVYVV